MGHRLRYRPARGSEALEGGMHNMFRNTPLYQEDLTGWDVETLDPDLNTSFIPKPSNQMTLSPTISNQKLKGYGRYLDKRNLRVVMGTLVKVRFNILDHAQQIQTQLKPGQRRLMEK